jgi:hypothetical protein
VSAQGRLLALNCHPSELRRSPIRKQHFHDSRYRDVADQGLDLDVVKINKGHVREFRDAAQLVPTRRSGNLLKATLPQLAEYSRAHPHAPRIKAATVNKWLNCLGAVLSWSWKNGLIPDEVNWSNPVSGSSLNNRGLEVLAYDGPQGAQCRR